MAATRLIAMHVNKGHTLAQSLGDRTDYAKNPEKTEKGELVTAYGCDPMTVDEEFLLQKRLYYQITGKTQQSDVIAYQIRQSFKPREVTPEQANELGRELALRFTKGKYSFIVATHTDRAHIHNHIIFNSTAMDGTCKFRSFLRSGLALQKVSDLICAEHGLSVISRLPYHERKKRNEYPKRENIREQICRDIDGVLEKKPKDFQEFLKFLEEADYEIKQGKHLAMKGKSQERFIRFSSMEEGYRESDIRAYFAGDGQRDCKHKKDVRRHQTFGLLFDIERLEKERGAGYARWATVYNLKQMAKAKLLTRDHNIESLAELHTLASDKSRKCDALLSSIRASETRLAEIATLKKHIINYSKTRGTYEAYRKAGYSKKFFEAHREEITLHKAAKQAFNELGVKKIPRMKDLNAEYAELLAGKKQAYAEYRRLRDEAREFQIAEKNISSLFETEKKDEQRKQKVREH